tara:strand:+ start:1531 stop:1671 length:141 start_codon:yes stop_codon:yes gene_type:complete
MILRSARGVVRVVRRGGFLYLTSLLQFELLLELYRKKALNKRALGF